MKTKGNQIILEGIPIDEHTSKYRFKRKNNNYVDYLVLQANQTITENDYIEWQISYDIKIENIYKNLKDGDDLFRLFGEGKSDKFRKTVVGEYKKINHIANARAKKQEFLALLSKVFKSGNELLISKHRKDKPIVITTNELSDFVRYAHLNGIITNADLDKIIRFAKGMTSYLDNEAHINREKSAGNKSFHGFDLFWEKYPLFIKEVTQNVFIEIQKKHMQYAIGYQNMIYLCIKAAGIKKEDGGDIIGQKPKELKKISFALDKEVLLETLRAFVIASEDHRNDILDILGAILTY